MFGDRKVAQMAAYLLDKADGKELDRIKLMKLMYLADREALRQTEGSISDDRFVAMKHGPVLSHTYNLMKGEQRSISGEWEGLIRNTGSQKVPRHALKIEVTREYLDELSPQACEILDQVWEEFGGKEPFALTDYTHTLKEWKDPGESSAEIPLARILEAVGCPKERAEGLEAFHAEQRGVSEALTDIQFGRA